MKIMTATINTIINIGDAGLPFDVSIEIEYEQKDKLIAVTYCMEDNCPYDNPPQVWFDQLKDKVEDYFYEQDKELRVEFV